MLVIFADTLLLHIAYISAIVQQDLRAENTKSTFGSLIQILVEIKEPVLSENENSNAHVIRVQRNSLPIQH